MPGLPAPSSSTFLAALPALVLDVETTGLDVTSDRVVQVAAITMLGPRILPEPRLERFVDPGIPIAPSATRIHGVSDADVAGAPRFADVAPTLQSLFDGRVLVGHHIAFDLAVLRHEAARARAPWRDPPALDVVLLVGALEPSLVDLSLDAIANRLGVTINGRHSAIGDAMAAAEIFTLVLSRLREIDVRTLGEAQSLAARRVDLVRRQAQARWHAVPGDAADVPLLASAPRLDSYVFERHVEDVMSSPPALVGGGATLREAAALMTSRRIGALLVGAAGEPPEGIVTERDVLRATARASLDVGVTAVRDVMSAPVACITAGEPLYRALGRMDRAGFRHLCVIDAEGRPLGMLSQRDLLHYRARAALALGDEIASAEDVTALAAAYGQVPTVVKQLLAEGLGAIEIARVVSSEIRALTGRAGEIVAGRLASEGRVAPAAWCLLVLGSAGRSESLLNADQDNALIHTGQPGDESWFAEFGSGIAGLLDDAGIARCKGGVMAAEVQWRGTLEQWHERIGGWLLRSRPEDLLNVDIFFDLLPVAGDRALARVLHAGALHAAAHAPRFIALLAQSVSEMSPPTGPFGGLKAQAGRVDLKRGGLLPLVGLARTLALRAGSRELSTPGRLRAAVAAGRISEADAQALIRLHDELLNLILQQQLADIEGGVRPSARVAVQPLGRQRTRRLARDLNTLEQMLQVLHSDVAG